MSEKRKRRPQYTRREIIMRLQDAHLRSGGHITSRDADKGLYSLPSVNAIKYHYGSWRAAMDAAGLSD